MAPPAVPTPTMEEVLNCQFSSWYETFRYLPDDRKRTNVTIKSIVLQSLPFDFIDFLLSDGIRLPLGATKVSSCAPNESQDEDDDVWSSSSSKWCDEEQDSCDAAVTSSPRQFSFPELNSQIEEAIQQLGGSVIPKLNWSSPKDATWVNNGTLKCKTPGDVYLLLKSSDFCMHDVLHAVEDMSKVNYELVLRKWCNLHPSMEFRCFVWNRELGMFVKMTCNENHPLLLIIHTVIFMLSTVAISQRQHTQHFPYLPRERVIIRSQILDFFDTVMENRFPSSNYVFDVYIDKKERVWLLDFNVWGSQTDPLLFEWEELMSLAEEETSFPEIRVVETELEIHHDPLASYRAPIDVIELATVTGSDASKFEEFKAMCEQPSNISDD